MPDRLLGACYRNRESLRQGTGESLQQFPLKPKDCVLAGRGYCHGSGIHHAAGRKAYLAVRLNPDGILLQTPDGSQFGLLQGLQSITATGQMEEWEVLVPFEDHAPVSARLCVVRKSQTAIALAHRKLRRYACKHGTQLQPETLVYAQYVMVLTTFPAPEFSLQQVLDHYRFRWQIELVFKRFKQAAQLGPCPNTIKTAPKPGFMESCSSAYSLRNSSGTRAPFPPWGYPLAGQATSRRWREFSFALHQVTAAIQPALALGDMPANRDQIAKGLADAPRKRKSQEQIFSQAVSAYAALVGGYLLVIRGNSSRAPCKM